MSKVLRAFWLSYGATRVPRRIGRPCFAATSLVGVPVRSTGRARARGVPPLLVTSTIVPKSYRRPTTSLCTSAVGLPPGDVDGVDGWTAG